MGKSVRSVTYASLDSFANRIEKYDTVERMDVVRKDVVLNLLFEPVSETAAACRLRRRRNGENTCSPEVAGFRSASGSRKH
jgi:hypothetical protein